MKYKFSTWVADAEIHQTVEHEFNGVMNELSHLMYNTLDAQFVEALIKLGWTPPEKQSLTIQS